jgi:Tfp pilus assembly protein PilF
MHGFLRWSVGFVASACVAALLLTLSGCSGSAARPAPAGLSDLAQQNARAREVAREASLAAAKAQRARERNRAAEAERFGAEAIELYRQALSLSQDMPEVWNNLGVELMRTENYMGASEAFGMAMQLSPTDPRPVENLALVYHRTGWDEESLRYYDMALERSPSSLRALRGAIKTSHLLGEADEKRLDQVRRALLMETDPAMREFFEREQVRILGRLEQSRRRRP